MQEKYELGTRLTYFGYKNEKKISLNFILGIRNPTFLTYMPQLLIIKICFTNKINTICVGGHLLVSGFQGPISMAPSVRSTCPRNQGLKVPSFKIPVPGPTVPSSWVSGSQVQDLRVRDPGYQGPRVPCIRVPGSQVSESWVSGSWVSGSQVPGSRVS